MGGEPSARCCSWQGFRSRTGRLSCACWAAPAELSASGMLKPTLLRPLCLGRPRAQHVPGRDDPSIRCALLEGQTARAWLPGDFAPSQSELQGFRGAPRMPESMMLSLAIPRQASWAEHAPGHGNLTVCRHGLIQQAAHARPLLTTASCDPGSQGRTQDARVHHARPCHPWAGIMGRAHPWSRQSDCL